MPTGNRKYIPTLGTNHSHLGNKFSSCGNDEPVSHVIIQYQLCYAFFWTKIFKNLTKIYNPSMLSDGILGIFAKFLKIFVLKEPKQIH